VGGYGQGRSPHGLANHGADITAALPGCSQVEGVFAAINQNSQEMQPGQDIEKQQPQAQGAQERETRDALEITQHQPDACNHQDDRKQRHAPAKGLLQQSDPTPNKAAVIGREQAEDGQEADQREENPEEIQLAIRG